MMDSEAMSDSDEEPENLFAEEEAKAARLAQLRKQRWEKEAEEKEKKRREDKERLAKEDAARREQLEQQRLLGLLEPPLISLLERLNLREELSLPLAVHSVTSLKHLRNLDQVTLSQTLDLDELAKESGRTDLEELLALAILSSRRDLSLQAIDRLSLAEDPEHVSEESGETFDQVTGERPLVPLSYEEDQEVKQEDRLPVRTYIGPLRKQLQLVTERWHDFLATAPALGSNLASNETIAPTWKETVAWATWMLTSRSLGRQYGNVSGWMSREVIEGYLQLVKEHVWCVRRSHATRALMYSAHKVLRHVRSTRVDVSCFVRRFALYPSTQKMSTSEWRAYWTRVSHNFNGFFSTKGILRWSAIAAHDARAEAVRTGKSSREQDAAATQAIDMVKAMLRTPAKRTPRRACGSSNSVSSLFQQPSRRGVPPATSGHSSERCGNASLKCTSTLRHFQARTSANGGERSRSLRTLPGVTTVRQRPGCPRDGSNSARAATSSSPALHSHRRRQSHERSQERSHEHESSYRKPETLESRLQEARGEAQHAAKSRMAAIRAETERVAAEAAAKHKGRRGSIAGAAAAAALLLASREAEYVNAAAKVQEDAHYQEMLVA